MGLSPPNHDVNAECAERIKRHKLCCSWGRGIHLHQFACQRPASRDADLRVVSALYSEVAYSTWHDLSDMSGEDEHGPSPS